MWQVPQPISPPFLETSLVVRTFPSVLVEAGTGLASPDCSSYNSFLTYNFPSTHHDVLECQPITKFLIAQLLLLSKSFIRVMHAELVAELLRLS